MMITVACVYRSGGDFDVGYVKRLALGVHRTLCTPHEFVCLTDISSEEFKGYPVDRVIPLEYDWPGWWAKMELFRLPGPLMYLDLDMVLVNSLDKLALKIIQHDDLFVMLRGFYRQDRCSGILGWNGELSKVFDDFYENYAKTATFQPRPNAVYMTVDRRQLRGDQEWLREYLKAAGSSLSVTMAQDITSGIYSYKVHVQRTGKIPDDARLICFHGRPRPHELVPVPDWITEYWRSGTRTSISRAQLLNMSRNKQLTNYPHRHEGATLLVLGGSATGLQELERAQAARPGALVAAIGYGAGFARVDMVVSDHYETHEELRSLQDHFGKDHYTTHCTFTSRATKYPAVDYWWNWRRAEASSVQTAIRIGLATGCKEIILCGCPLEHGTVQHPLQRQNDGDQWPPPRYIAKHGHKTGQETSAEILTMFQKYFVQFAADWNGKVFSMSGFTRDILGAPDNLDGPLPIAHDNNRQRAINQWSGREGARKSWPKNSPRWPDNDSIALLQTYCHGVLCEIGCGIGRCAEAFPPEQYIGVDINAEAIQLARSEFPHHRFEAIKWDDPYPEADTYLFYTMLLHIPDGELVDILKRTDNGNGKPKRLVIFESMSRSLRNTRKGNYQRDPSEYEHIFAGLKRTVIDVRSLSSKVYPFFRHFMVVK